MQDAHPEIVECLTGALIAELESEGRGDALQVDASGRTRLWSQPYEVWERERIYQFDRSRGVTGFPTRPEAVHYEQPDPSRTTFGVPHQV